MVDKEHEGFRVGDPVRPLGVQIQRADGKRNNVGGGFREITGIWCDTSGSLFIRFGQGEKPQDYFLAREFTKKSLKEE